MATTDAINALRGRFPTIGEARPLMNYADGRNSNQLFVRVPANQLVEVCRFLRDDPACRFEQLADLTCVDYLHFPNAEDRFGVTYNLASHSLNHRLWLKVYLNDPEPTVASVTGVWKGAEWMEREVFDLFGIRFSGHPDLRRILCPDWFTDHPLRKDYPLTGKGERERFEVVRRDSA